MNRLPFIFISALVLVGCETPSEQPAEPVAVTSSAEVKFSWENGSTSATTATAAVNLEAPKDATKARILEIRDDSGLLAIAQVEKPAVKSRLQIIKDNKVLLVEVASVNEAQIVVNIVPHQLKRPELYIGDEVICTPAPTPVIP